MERSVKPVTAAIGAAPPVYGLEVEEADVVAAPAAADEPIL